MSPVVFIDGHAGTTGLGIAERLRAVPGITLRPVAETDRKSPAARLAAMRDADLVILCLPDDAARESVALAATLGADAPKILDASTAHRTAPGWVYGFAERDTGHAARIAAADTVANPGCYATGAIALLYPLVAAGVLRPDAPISIGGVSGYSGGGNAMIADHTRDAGPAFELYALHLAHKHVPEIVAWSGLTRTPIFVPAVAHLRQGMLVTIPLHAEMLTAAKTAADLQALLHDHYAPMPGQVRVVPLYSERRMRPDTLNGTDLIELTVHGDDTRAVLVARLDNLGKGASGAAVQNARLMLGLPA